MGSFYAPQTTVVDLGDGNTVTLRKLTYGEVADLLAQCTTADGRIDAVRYSRGQVERGLVEWFGAGFDGRDATPENVRALPVRIGRKLGKAAATLNEDVSEDEGN